MSTYFTSLLLAISLVSSSVHLISAEATDSNMNNNIPIPSADDDGATRNMLELSSKCHNTLLASATSTGRLHQDNYFVFTDGLSNGYYTQHNMTTYSELPLSNKYSFVTLSCVCSSNDRIFKGSRVGGGGGSDNSNTDEKCCQGVRANINIASMMENEYEYLSYVNDICSMTLHAIGVENVLPPTGEEPYRPGVEDGGGDLNDEKVEEEEDGEEEVMNGSAPLDPEKIKVTVETSGEGTDDIDRTSSSATANAVSVVTQPNAKDDDNTNQAGGLSIGALSGIFVATIVVGLVLFGLIVTSSQKKTKNNNSDAEEDDSVSESGGSYVGVVNENDNHEEEEEGEWNSSDNDEVNNDGNYSTAEVTHPPSRRVCKYRDE